MPDCPFCGEYFVDQDKLSAHVFSEHPEKVSTPDSMARAMAAAGEEQSLRSIAAMLAESSLRSGKSADEVVGRYQEVLFKLRQWQ